MSPRPFWCIKNIKINAERFSNGFVFMKSPDCKVTKPYRCNFHMYARYTILPTWCAFGFALSFDLLQSLEYRNLSLRSPSPLLYSDVTWASSRLRSTVICLFVHRWTLDFCHNGWKAFPNPVTNIASQITGNVSVSPPVTGRFLSQRMESVSESGRHHAPHVWHFVKISTTSAK